MKAFLQHDENGLFYREDGWVTNVADARSFATVEDAELFRSTKHVPAAHTVSRLDPVLIARLRTRPPGMYQAGE